MDAPLEPHRCPKCGALVVDRRSPVCTTCRCALPAEWIMSKEQADKMVALDQEMRREHTSSINTLDPRNDPNTPAVVRFLEIPWGL